MQPVADFIATRVSLSCVVDQFGILVVDAGASLDIRVDERPAVRAVGRPAVVDVTDHGPAARRDDQTKRDTLGGFRSGFRTRILISMADEGLV